jgi:hypothetical protein
MYALDVLATAQSQKRAQVGYIALLRTVSNDATLIFR